MTDSEKIISYSKANKGYITTKFIQENKINTMSLTRLVKDGKLKKYAKVFM